MINVCFRVVEKDNGNRIIAEVRCLDLEDCGVGGRLGQENAGSFQNSSL